MSDAGAATPAGRSAKTTRIEFLDGLRCFAILPVVLFHYFVRWASPNYQHSLYPYENLFADWTAFKYGFLGVELFFIISGFVIAMTLERCRTPREFAARRYARLAPAMIIFSLVTYFVETLVPSSPFYRTPVSFLSSLTFIEPRLLNQVFHTDAFNTIDGVYWSLFIEVKFYVLAAILYFGASGRLVSGIALLSIVAIGLNLYHVPVASALGALLLFPEYLPWFVMGIGFFRWHKDGMASGGWRLVLLGVTEIAILAVHEHSPSQVGAAVVLPLFFLASLQLPTLQRLLSWRPLVLIGTSSYGFYLLHQDVGVTLLHALPAYFHERPLVGALAALLLIAALAIVARLSFVFIEQRASAVLLRALLPPRPAHP